LKTPTGSVQFRFFKPGTGKTEPKKNPEKTEPNRKPSQTGLNRFFSKKPNRNETGRFEPVLVRFRFFLKKKIRFGYFF
jgi:hypothetical protein